MEPVAWAVQKPVSRRSGGVLPRRTVAALDLGTNNCRLLIARPAADGFRVVDAFSRIVRLGEGVGATGRLAVEAMDRAIAALRICAAKMRRRGVARSRAVATEACRRAANFETFRARVLDQTEIALEVIPAAEEARLALAGCAPLLDPALTHALVFDIGGGSTELMWLTVGSTIDGEGGDEDSGIAPGPDLIDSISLPLGVVTLAERHGGDRVPLATYQAMVAEAIGALACFEQRHRIRDRIAAGTVQMLGSSGTVTTLAGVFQNLPRYDRSLVDGSFLDFETAARVSRELLAMDFARRAAHPCIGRERADLVVAGCAVLEAICKLWPVGRLRIADRGVREGILLDLVGGRTPAATEPAPTAAPVAG